MKKDKETVLSRITAILTETPNLTANELAAMTGANAMVVRDSIRRAKDKILAEGSPKKFFLPVKVEQAKQAKQVKVKVKKSRVFWDDQDITTLAREVAENAILEPFRFTPVQAVVYAMHKRLPESSWRNLVVVPERLKVAIAEELKKLQERLFQAPPEPIEMPEPVLDVERSLAVATQQQLYAAIGERQDRIAALVEKLVNTRPQLNTVVHQSITSVAPVVERPRPPRIAVVGLLDGQEQHIRRDVGVHLDRKNVVLTFIPNSRATHVTGLQVDKVLCLDKVSHQTWEHARSWAPSPDKAEFLHGLSSIRDRILDAAGRYAMDAEL